MVVSTSYSPPSPPPHTRGIQMRACLILPLLLLASPVAADTILVDHGGSGDYLTIEEGLSAAVYGDTVVVACGTYHEHDLVMMSGVCLRSETGEPECVTVDADSLGRAFYCSGADSTTVVEGLTITRGLRESVVAPYDGGGMYWADSSPKILSCTFTDNQAHNTGGISRGGALAFSGCSPVIMDCSFSGNTARTSWPHGNTYGGAVSLGSSEAMISSCTFSSNRASEGGGLYAGSRKLMITDCVFEDNWAVYGGGMEVYGFNFDLTMTDCQFLGNDAHQGGGAILGRDATITGCTFADNTAVNIGGMQCFSGTTVTDCLFVGNIGDYGGGIDCTGASLFEGCTITDNRSGWTAGGISLYAGGTMRECVVLGNLAELRGGGVVCGNPHQGSTSIIDCVVADNETYETGGGIACVETLDISIVGCTISGNTAWGGGGAISAEDGAEPVVERTILAFSHAGGAALCDSTGAITLIECDVFGNEEGDWVDCIAGQESTSGNFSLDPLFCDMYSGDFSVCANSPCLPAAGGQRDLVGALGQGCDNCDSPVECALFVGACSERVVTIRWTMENPGGFTGLNVYRATETGGPFTKLNESLLPALSPGAYIDTTVWPAATFFYRLAAVRHEGSEGYIGDTLTASTPGRLPAALHAPNPNPFSDRCSVVLDLPSPTARAVVAVFDVSGRRVATLHDAPLPRGRREFSWDGSDDAGSQCASGIYFLRCDAGHAVLRQRVALMR